MKAVILAGGKGTRISEETSRVPKPMVEIGGRPLLWHLLKIFSVSGIKDFIICAGYKSDVIKRYFLEYRLLNSDFSVSLKGGGVVVLNPAADDWNVTIIDTGLESKTGERIRRVLPYIQEEEFVLAYGDTLADINVCEIIDLHRSKKADVTMTASVGQNSVGNVFVDANLGVIGFSEKSQDANPLINRGFFVINRHCLDAHVWATNESWEYDTLPLLVKNERVYVYKHSGFVQSMDSLKEKNILEDLWVEKAPWKRW